MSPKSNYCTDEHCLGSQPSMLIKYANTKYANQVDHQIQVGWSETNSSGGQNNFVNFYESYELKDQYYAKL